MKLSDPERLLLREIQRDASQSVGALAETCGMAQSTAWRKLQEFEKAGLIRGRVALLDPQKAGCGLLVLASVTLRDHAEQTVTGFNRLIRGHPEIIECHVTSGQADYHLKIRVADMAAYEAFMTDTLLRSSLVQSLQSAFVLKELKSTTELPL